MCIDGDIRLSAGRNAIEGRVEICSGGTWGTVCDDFWSAIDAQVVCNQLGFANTSKSQSQSKCFRLVLTKYHIILCIIGAVAIYAFAAGTGPIYLDNVHCIGSESRLIDCLHNGVGIHNCIHSQDAGVRCLLPCTFACILMYSLRVP